jgi:hypothetical protein
MKFLTMSLKIITAILSFHTTVFSHEMQHGFILSENDTFASHLVAPGHHSHQVEVVGQLAIQDASERLLYDQRKKMSGSNQTYFLFQAQQLNLPKLNVGKILLGHIVESKVERYEPKNIIVKSAAFQVRKILLNLPNPFFLNEVNLSKPPAQQHCCDTGAKPCNWKC